MTEVYGNKK